MSETQTTTYQPGDEVTIDGGNTIILGRRRGNTGIRWTWIAPATDTAGGSYWPTPEAAINHARQTLTGARCRCGRPATMNASLGPTCIDCYDRHSD